MVQSKDMFYYGCTRARNINCKCGYLREENLIEQLSKILDKIDLDELGIQNQFKEEFERYSRFNKIILGIDDNKFKQIFDGVSLLGRSARVTKDEEAFSTFNDAFTAQPTDGDGTELCASDHPYSPTDTGTQSNEGTTALSNAAVVAAKKLMRRFNNSKRKNAQIQPDLIVIPTELEETAKEIFEALEKYFSVTQNEDSYEVYSAEYFDIKKAFFG